MAVQALKAHLFPSLTLLIPGTWERSGCWVTDLYPCVWHKPQLCCLQTSHIDFCFPDFTDVTQLKPPGAESSMQEHTRSQRKMLFCCQFQSTEGKSSSLDVGCPLPIGHLGLQIQCASLPNDKPPAQQTSPVITQSHGDKHTVDQTWSESPAVFCLLLIMHHYL